MDFPLEKRPEDLFQAVLKDVGCSHRRDAFDRAVIEQVRTGTAPRGDRGFVNTPEECGGYPVLAHKEPAPATNLNGIPDKLERKYSDIEDYLNSLVK